MTVLKRFLEAPGDSEHQGLPLSGERQTLVKEGNRVRKLTDDLSKLVKAGLDKQTSTAMLRAYAGPASQYTLRSCEICFADAAEYDVALASCWPDLLGRAVSTEEPRQWLPLRMGGMGASSARSRVFAAPWAAWSAIQEQVAGHVGAPGAEEPLQIAPASTRESPTSTASLWSKELGRHRVHDPSNGLVFGNYAESLSLTHT